MNAKRILYVIVCLMMVCLSAAVGNAQVLGPVNTNQSLQAPGLAGAAPVTLTLRDAQRLAEANFPQYLATLNDAGLAREDTLQARAARKPTASFRSDYLGTQGNGTLPSGRFVTNDGVHVYRDWAVVHQDFTAAFTNTTIRKAAEIEALARARVEIARRGLSLTVARVYYALLTGQRKYATAQQGVEQARRYLDISQRLERGGEVAHSDVVKAQLQVAGQEQIFRDAELTMDNARLDLSVLLYRDFTQNFVIVDDLALASPLPPREDAQAMAGLSVKTGLLVKAGVVKDGVVKDGENPDLGAANASLRAAQLDVTIARQAFLPSLTSDFAYGIEANAFALHAMRANLEHVMTDAAYVHMIALAENLRDRLTALFRTRGVNWSVTQIGARLEFQFCASPPRTGREAEAAFHDPLEKCIHLALLNRGVMITPFHNMILMCPQTTVDEVERLVGALDETIGELRNA